MASDSASRMLAARVEIIERLRKSAELHALTDGELVAVGIHATAAALQELFGVTADQAGEGLQTAVNRYRSGLPR